MKFPNREVRVLEEGQHYATEYATVVRQSWDDKETTLQIRRVVHQTGKEELQIEIAIFKFGDKRNTEAYSSFCCSPEIADQIAEACKVVRIDRTKDTNK